VHNYTKTTVLRLHSVRVGSAFTLRAKGQILQAYTVNTPYTLQLSGVYAYIYCTHTIRMCHMDNVYHAYLRTVH